MKIVLAYFLLASFLLSIHHSFFDNLTWRVFNQQITRIVIIILNSAKVNFDNKDDCFFHALIAQDFLCTYFHFNGGAAEN